MKNFSIILLIFLVSGNNGDECIKKETCHDCIQEPGCSWCSLQNVKTPCFDPINTQLICDQNYIYNPQNELNIVPHLEHEVVSEFQQLTPKEIKLKLRKNEALKVNIKFKQYTHFPLDLYYLMDISNSMEDDKDKLSAIGNTLVESMKNITAEFRLGFGTFVDKVVMPYVSIVPQKLLEPCNNCATPYGFRNHMSLSHDTHHFSGEVNNAKISGNLDDPEGGFDAIMQAIVCKKEIGWGEKYRRKVLVFATDSLFHYAGDGKLGGIVKPNDCKCHLDENGFYNYTTLQDYPSLSELNREIQNNAINVVFAATAERKDLYKELSKHIEGSTVGELKSDSSNIIELIKEEYQKITSSVVMKDTSSNNLQVNFYSKCLDSEGPLVKTNRCDGLKDSLLVEFEAEVKIKSCPKNKKDWNETFQIYPVGINESISVHLEYNCDCPCENSNNEGFKSDAAECSFHGALKCGKCECSEQYFGNRCQCDMEALKSDDDHKAGCRPDNTTLIECSSRGSCICGQCYCDKMLNPNEIIYGQFCECDNFSCDRANSLLCSGPNKGKCDCGVCKCEDGWSGHDCSCSTSIETCRRDTNELCSNRGECICGKCVCNETSGFTGKYCDKYADDKQLCSKLQICVKCEVLNEGSEELCRNSCLIEHKTKFTSSRIEIVSSIEVNETLDEQLCINLDGECNVHFSYYYDNLEDKIVVRAKRQRECHGQLAGAIPGILLATIIFICGLMCIGCWKLVTNQRDKNEWKKFYMERELFLNKLEENHNPLYEKPISHYNNPLYGL